MKILRCKRINNKPELYCLFLEDGKRLTAQENDILSLIKENEDIIYQEFGEGKLMTSKKMKFFDFRKEW